jgi:beta-glucosidase
LKPVRPRLLGVLALGIFLPALVPPALAGPSVHPALWPAVKPGVARDADTEEFVTALLAELSLEEKIGQLLQADIASVTPEDVRRYHLGAVLAGGNSGPDGDVHASAARWLELADAFHAAALADAAAGHAAVPLLFGIDAVHGNARVPGATVFPHNVGLGATDDPALIEEIGRASALEVAAIGVDWTFAPTVAVARDPRWGRAYESYSEDPLAVARDASAFLSGLQGRPGSSEFLGPDRTLASVKHFLGDGGTLRGRDQYDGRASEQTLRDVHGSPYAATLAAGALVVMASYSGWQGVKMHVDRPLLTSVLKERWEFPGFVIGDWNAQEEIPGCTRESCAAMLRAGIDLYMAPDSWQGLREHLLADARSGRIPLTRIDDAVRRILRVKKLAGLFDPERRARRAAAAPPAELGSAAHRALARRAVRESLVLLKNDAALLPLDPRGRILVAGDAADDIGRQCGGWTIDWQGTHNTKADFPGGTSILDGIRATVGAAGGVVEYRADGRYTRRPSAAVVVYGETPYAEYEGDRETLEFTTGAASTRAILRRLRAAGIPVVSVFLSGRPLWVNPELNASDAFIAAWLPGTEGGGVADLLFAPADGSAPREFTGRLGFSWPRSAQPVRFDAAGRAHGALFPRGFGRSLGPGPALARLDEHPGGPATRRPRSTLFAAGHVTAPWSAMVGDAAGEVRLTSRRQPSPGGVVTARIVARALRVSWSGPAGGSLRFAGRGSDYVRRAREGGAVVVRYAVDRPPRGTVRLAVLCEAPYGAGPAPADTSWSDCGLRSGAALDLTRRFRATPRGTWRTLRVPLACFRAQGAELERVDSPLALQTDDRFALRIAQAELTAGTPGTRVAARCPPPADRGG